MSKRSWTFRGLEFRSVMSSAGRDRLPFPLQFRPDAVSAEDYDRQRRDAHHVATDALDDDLRIALHAISNPNHRVEIVGHTRKPAGDVKIRAHAAIRHDVGVVLVQAPGLDDSTGSDVTVTLVDNHRAVGRVLDALPSCKVGGTPRVDVTRTPGPEDSLFRAAASTTDLERFNRILGRPRSSAGEILICPGASVDGRPEDAMRGFHWIDVDGDGRYIVRHGSTVSMLPATTSDLESEVRRSIHDATVIV